MVKQIPWRPHPGPQTKFHTTWAYDVMYGGRKGPGKTECILRESTRQIHLPLYRGCLFRRTFPRLGEIIDRSFKYFKGMGAKFSDHDIQLKLPAWTFPVPNETKFVPGAKVAFSHCQNEADKYNHQGKEWHYLGFDQLEEFTETQFLFLIAQNRTSQKEIRCYIRSSANPGGVGHGWVKKRYIEPLKPYVVGYFKRVDNEDLEVPASDPHGLSRQFIPASIYDNPSLMENDPDYVRRLEQLPEDDKQALLHGNWDVFKGQYFKMWRRAYHVVEKPILKENIKFLSLDYGYANPSSVGWWMVDYDGNLHRYRELYREGLTYSKLAETVREMTPTDEKIDYCVADPAIWGDKAHHANKEGLKGESGAETMQEIWDGFTTIIKGDNNRITGWGRMRELMTPIANADGTYWAKFTVSPACKDFIRTVPILIHDDKKVEDIDTSGEDHAADESRYAVMSRPEKPILRSVETLAQQQMAAGDPFSLPEIEPEPERGIGEMEMD
jgi:hypothetical protein